MADVPTSADDTVEMLGINANAVDKQFWDHLAALFYQLAACTEFTSISSGEHASENTIWGLAGQFWPLRAPTDDSTPTSPVRDVVNRTKETIRSAYPTWTFSFVYTHPKLPFRNLVLELHDEFIQILKLPEHSASVERKRWTANPAEICEHLLTWDEKSLKLLSGASSASNAIWLFNFLVRLEQLIALVPISASEDERRRLMEKHRLLSDRLAKHLPRGNYRACFDEEEKANDEDVAARLAKMDEVKWQTRLPKALNELTSSYCSSDITSDRYVNAVLDSIERVKRIAS